MGMFSKKSKMVNIEVDANELSSAHVRTLKSINSLLNHVLTTDDESEYFDGGAEVMRMCASLIKQARFPQGLKADNVPYAEQALEYSMDLLEDYIAESRVITYDN